MDKAYEDDQTRLLAKEKGFIPVVPPKINRKKPWNYDKELFSYPFSSARRTSGNGND